MSKNVLQPNFKAKKEAEKELELEKLLYELSQEEKPTSAPIPKTKAVGSRGNWKQLDNIATLHNLMKFKK